MFNEDDIKTFGLLLGLLLLNLLFAAIVAYQTAHYIIRPLRKLNNKMIDILFSA
jgi:nitrogen fixation/metabolism regulation signal transduction histidine kinase